MPPPDPRPPPVYVDPLWILAQEVSTDHYIRNPGIVTLLNGYLALTITYIQTMHLHRHLEYIQQPYSV